MKKTKSLGKTPVFYGYIIAFEARNLQGVLNLMHVNLFY